VSLRAITLRDGAVGLERPDRFLDIDEPILTKRFKKFDRAVVAILDVVGPVVVATAIVPSRRSATADTAALFEDGHRDRCLPEFVGDTRSGEAGPDQTEPEIVTCRHTNGRVASR
jgi:hypothetical protein